MRDMKIYKFKLGYNITEHYYLSDFTEEEITSLWEITENKPFRERLNYITENAKLLDKRFDGLKIDKDFLMPLPIED